MRGRPKAQGKGKPYSLCLSASDGWAGGWSIKRLERSVGFRRHLWYNVPRAFIFEDKPCDVSLGLEPSLWAASLYAYGYSAQGLYVVGTNDARSPWAWSRPSGPVLFLHNKRGRMHRLPMAEKGNPLYNWSFAKEKGVFSYRTGGILIHMRVYDRGTAIRV